MTRMKPIAAALAAIGMVALASPAQAGEVEDLKATMKKMMERIEQLEAQQKSQAAAAKAVPAATASATPAAIPANVVVAGDLPNSIKIPGTDTSIRVYGYAQLDTTYDFKGRQADIDNFDWASFVAAQPLDNSLSGKRKKQIYATMKTSRLGLETSTPTGEYGNLKVKLEGDFNAPNAFQGESQTNSVLFRLRHAYGELGNVLVGQTWSNFLDLGSFADTVDFNGPGAVPQIRQPQVRYTFPLSASSRLTLSVENPQSGTAIAGSLNPSTPPNPPNVINYDKKPDVVANYTQSFKDGHFSLRAVTLNYNTDVDNKQAFAFGAGGSYKLSNNDTIVAQINGGKGIGRYMLNSLIQAAADDGNEIHLWKSVGGHVGYTHAWNQNTRSNLIAAYTKFDGDSYLEDPANTGDLSNKNIKEVSVNTFWKPTKNTELGLEYAWGQRETFEGDKGTQSRVNATFRASLF